MFAPFSFRRILDWNKPPSLPFTQMSALFFIPSYPRLEQATVPQYVGAFFIPSYPRLEQATISPFQNVGAFFIPSYPRLEQAENVRPHHPSLLSIRPSSSYPKQTDKN